MKKEEIPSSAEQEMFMCEICFKKMKAITNTHLKKHGITASEYKQTYPCSVLSNCSTRFENWRSSDDNRQNLIKMNKVVYTNPAVLEKKRKAQFAATHTPEYKQKLSAAMKKASVENENTVNRHKNAKLYVTDWQKLSNFERWKIKFGEEKANELQQRWSAKNKLPGNSRNTSIEKCVHRLLEQANIKFQTQYSVAGCLCDIFVNEHNVIIEVDGDYWHANPTKFAPTDIISKKTMSAEAIWASDKERQLRIENCGYRVLRYWGSETKSLTHEKLLEDIVRVSSKVETV